MNDMNGLYELAQQVNTLVIFFFIVGGMIHAVLYVVDELITSFIGTVKALIGWVKKIRK